MRNTTLCTTLNLLLLVLLLGNCRPGGDHASAAPDAGENPAASGFNTAASDEEAIRIADEVMKAMGGRQAWNNTHFISWNFFGRRMLLWDKYTGRVRIEAPADSTVFLINIRQDTGRVLLRGQPVTHPDSLAKYVGRGKSIWINDAYWLVMPYKLKDSGVTLTYLGEDTIQTGRPADLLQLTFDNVGDTPQNKYHVYVDKESRLVTQWAYFANAADPEPGFITPWDNYQTYGGILLSGDRGERRLSDIRVLKDVPDAAFEDFNYRLVAPQ